MICRFHGKLRKGENERDCRSLVLSLLTGSDETENGIKNIGEPQSVTIREGAEARANTTTRFD